MPKSRPSIKWVEPGYMAYYSLDELTKRKKNAPSDQWGICAAENTFWIGPREHVEGEDLLRVPLVDILDTRDEEYSEFGDEDVFLFVGKDVGSGNYCWFLLDGIEAKSRIDGSPLTLH